MTFTVYVNYFTLLYFTLLYFTLLYFTLHAYLYSDTVLIASIPYIVFMFSELFLTFEKVLTAKLPSRLVERAEIMHVTYSIPSRQWAAVNTHLLSIKLPPQKWNHAPLYNCSDTCQGHSFCSAWLPPTILDCCMPTGIKSNMVEGSSWDGCLGNANHVLKEGT